jgi:hypothetical protein
VNFGKTHIAILGFLLLAQTTFCQVVSSVSFKADNRGKINVQYLFSLPKEGQSYTVSLLASTNGGSSYMAAKSLEGDIGTVTTSGWKSITWDVLEDVESFEGENCIVKVVAEEIHATSELVSNFLFGDNRLKEKSNGITWGVGWTKTTFPNASTIEANGGYDIGARYIAIPLIVDVDCFFQNYSFPQDYIQGYSGLSFDGINLSASTSILPIAQTIIPSVGLGYQASALSLGTSSDNSGVQMATNSLYGIAAGQINLGSAWKLVGSYKVALFQDTKKWNQLIISIGFSYHAIKPPNE